MHRYFLLILTLITCASIQAQVINYEIDPSYSSGEILTHGGISDMLLLEGDQVLIMGQFNDFQSSITTGCILNSSGSLSLVMNYGGPNVDRYKNSFLKNGGVLRMFDTNGINENFKFEYSKSAYSSFISEQAASALVVNDSLIIVGGIFFTDSMDLSANSIRQLCMVDSTGAPVPDFPSIQCEPVNGRIQSLEKLSTGEIIVSGFFTSVNGHPSNNIAKLNANYTIDTSFISEFTGTGTVFIKKIDSQDRIWLSGTSTAQLVNQPNVHLGVLRLQLTGSLDEGFQIPTLNGTYLGSTTNSFAGEVYEDDDGSYILGGFFNKYNDVPVKGIVKINDDGSLINGVFENWGADEAEWGIWTYDFGGGVDEIRKLPDGKVLVGGTFSSFNGEPQNCLIRLQPNGFVSVDEKENRGKLRIYPNPAGDFTKVELPNKNQQIKNLSFYDMSGRLVLSSSGYQLTAGIDISELTPGMYVVQGNTDDGVFTGKVLVE